MEKSGKSKQSKFWNLMKGFKKGKSKYKWTYWSGFRDLVREVWKKPKFQVFYGNGTPYFRGGIKNPSRIE